jgi:hypothetical protein
MSKTQRLAISYKQYNLKPISTIKSLLGYDVKIISIKTNDVVLSNESVVVDVEYSDIPIDSSIIHYIPVSKFKQIIPNGTTCVVMVKERPVKVTLRENPYKRIIPLRINKVQPNNTIESEQADQTFSYFGIVVKNPLSYYCTIVKHPGMFSIQFDPPKVDKIYPDGFKFEHKITEEKMMKSYQNTIKKISSLGMITGINKANSLEECSEYTKGYIIDWEHLSKEKSLKGVLLIQPDRLPFSVLFIPSQMHRINEIELENIDKLLQMDFINYMNYNYIVN